MGDLLGIDIPDIDVSGFLDERRPSRLENRYVLPKHYKQVPQFRVKYEHAESLAEELGGEIMAGSQVAAILSGNFIFGDFIEALAVTQNVFIDELQVSTLSISKDNVDSLHNLIAGDYLGQLDIIVSDYFWSHNRQNAPYIYGQLDIDDKFQMAVAGTHTKITLMRIGEKKIVMSGSANFRSSRSVEELRIETSPELFDFHHAWQSEILASYATVKKPVRASALFELVTQGVEDKTSWHQE